MSKQYLLGLIGYPLGHSFSKGYFADKFAQKESEFSYDNYPLEDVNQFSELLKTHPNLVGLNVTIPYKKLILPYLDSLDSLAQKVGAVNTISIQNGKIKGYNTDVYGFSQSLKNTLRRHSHLTARSALILGTGGASQAVKVALENMGIAYQFVSRKEGKNLLTYQDLYKKGLEFYDLIINTTPLGMHPKVDKFPDLPYADLTSKHLLFDLVYNPEETSFLRKGKKQGSTCKNGLEMLALQADESLKIWVSELKTKEKLSTLDTSKSSPHLGSDSVDFSNTQIAFASKSDKELKATDRIFKLMSNAKLVKYGSKLGILALKMQLPFVTKIVKNTIYNQFCGGTSLLDSLDSIKKLEKQDVLTILDYSAEGKDDKQQLDKTMNEIIRAIEFAKAYKSIPIVSVKVSGLARNSLLEQLLNSSMHLEMNDLKEYRVFLQRMDNICHSAKKRSITVYFDAEESWMQNAIDHVVTIMMRRYNKEKAFVFNTYQLYRHDRLAALMKAHEDARKDDYILGVKTVRGAYLEQERERATEKGYEDPIQINKKATDEAYNMAVRFCLDNIDTIALCNATHNAESCKLHVDYLHKNNIPIDHPNQIIAQLFGMSDNISFNLSAKGYRVAKYLPYGPVKEVLPYLVRRAEENTSITGDLTRERGLILQELKRRNI